MSSQTLGTATATRPVPSVVTSGTPKRGSLSLAFAVALLLAGLATVGYAAAHLRTNKPAPGERADVTSTTVGTSPATVLLDVSGNGAKQTQNFTAATDWDIAYSYDCSNFGQQGNFIVTVYGDNAQPSLSNPGVNTIGTNGSDVTHEHHGGRYYLGINSECAWSIRVTPA